MTRTAAGRAERRSRGSRGLRAPAGRVLNVQTAGDVPSRPTAVRSFRSTVWGYWKKNGRHDLPWRKTKDPYRILVSEIMLQQTQVSRVTGRYKEFLKAFPTVRALAKASLGDVLKVWSGLGYNRRGKYLHDAAKVVVEKYGGNFKKALEQKLPGVGPYTRAAVRAFAFNEPGEIIETNVRTAFIHHFFDDKKSVSDTQVFPVVRKAAEGQDPRTWHSALMDYGSHLKKSGVRNNSKSVHYTKQSKFEGSLRQVRGGILRALHSSSKTQDSLRSDLKNSKRSDLGKFRPALASLARDGLIVKEKGRWSIA